MATPFVTGFSFRTRLSAEEALARLRASIDPLDRHRAFNGEVSGDRFVIASVDRVRPNRPARARMRGRVIAERAGAMVSGTHAPTALAVGLTALALAGLILVAGVIVSANLHPGAPAKNLIIPIGILAAAIALTAFAAVFGLRYDLGLLQKLIEGQRA